VSADALQYCLQAQTLVRCVSTKPSDSRYRLLETTSCCNLPGLREATVRRRRMVTIGTRPTTDRRADAGAPANWHAMAASSSNWRRQRKTSATRTAPKSSCRVVSRSRPRNSTIYTFWCRFFCCSEVMDEFASPSHWVCSSFQASQNSGHFRLRHGQSESDSIVKEGRAGVTCISRLARRPTGLNWIKQRKLTLGQTKLKNTSIVTKCIAHCCGWSTPVDSCFFLLTWRFLSGVVVFHCCWPPISLRSFCLRFPACDITRFLTSGRSDARSSYDVVH
jgi:hypothetical protein